MSNPKDIQDPIVMYSVMRESLLREMGLGKCIAQAQHCSEELGRKYGKLDKRYERYETELSDYPRLSTTELHNYYLYTDWLKEGVRKVVLKADDKEWDKLKEEFGSEMVLIRDAGITKLPAGSETCIGLWPRRRSQRSKLLTRLQALGDEDWMFDEV